MELLKKILTIMVVILVFIVVGGGFYLTSMGGMDHGTGNQVTDASQGPKLPDQATNNQTSNNQQSNNQQSNNQTNISQRNANTGTSTNQTQIQPQNGQPTVPQVVVVQPPVVQNSPEKINLYIELLKSQLKSINESNVSIAQNSAGLMTAQSGSATPSGQQDMNELHGGFYKLGRDVVAMEQTIAKLSEGMNNPGSNVNNNYTSPLGTNQVLNQDQQNQLQVQQQLQQQIQLLQQQLQQQQLQQQQLQQQQLQQGADQTSHTTQSTFGSLFSSNSLKLVLTVVLLASIVFGGISIAGFIGSLFTTRGQRDGTL